METSKYRILTQFALWGQCQSVGYNWPAPGSYLLYQYTVEQNKLRFWLCKQRQTGATVLLKCFTEHFHLNSYTKKRNYERAQEVNKCIELIFMTTDID